MYIKHFCIQTSCIAQISCLMHDYIFVFWFKDLVYLCMHSTCQKKNSTSSCQLLKEKTHLYMGPQLLQLLLLVLRLLPFYVSQPKPMISFLRWTKAEIGNKCQVLFQSLVIVQTNGTVNSQLKICEIIKHWPNSRMQGRCNDY